MGLLDQGAANLLGIGQKSIKQPTFVANDFTDGFVIEVYINGQIQKDKTVSLKGPFMPQVPFTFGGEQRLVTEYYPGNSEPTVNVLGPKEHDLTVKGHFRLKKFKRQFINPTGTQSTGATSSEESADTRKTGQAYQEALDQLRKDGNLVKLILGEWHRWGFIQDVTFDFKTLAEINYEIKFLIVGDKPPKNSKIVQKDKDPTRAQKDLINAANASIDAMKAFPTTMNQGISDFLNDQISAVAGAIGLVTGFVDDILKDAEKLNASVNRALGLIKNARTTISQTIRRVGTISTSVANMGQSFSNEWQKTSATIQSINHTQVCKTEMQSLMAYLADLQAKFQSIKQTTPLFRHLVKDGDTLQTISIKYYQVADNWKTIYDSNKLTSTQLTIGSVLTIPRI